MRTITDKTYSPIHPLNIAFIGMGVMGYPMAAHLARAGHRVTVYNRTAARAQEWLAQCGHLPGAATAATPREAAHGADMVLCCVGNDDDLRSVILGTPQADGSRATDGALAGMCTGSVLIDHTTASASVAREIATAAAQQGVAFADAPVSGGQAGAENGQLTVLCGASSATFERIAPVLAAYARACTHLGDVGSGQLGKMVNQICIAGLLQALAEGLAFGQRAGLDMDKVLAAIGQGAAQSWQMHNRGQTMIAGEFDFGFAVDWMRKDLGLVLQEARYNGTSLPVTALVDQFYADVQQAGGGRWDTSSLITRLHKR